MTDAHLHLSKEAGSLQDEITYFLNTTDPGQWPELQALHRTSSHIVPFFGIHPWFLAAARDRDLTDLEAIISSRPDYNVGEIGLDRIRAKQDPADCSLEQQLKWFKAQLQLAVSYSRPVTIHCVKAWDLLFPLLEELQPASGWLGIIHFFGSSLQVMQQLIDYGFYISFAPQAFRSPRVLAALQHCPENRLLLETDLEIGGNTTLLAEHYRQTAALRQLSTEKLNEVITTNGKIFKNRTPAG